MVLRPLGTDPNTPDCTIEACGEAIYLWTGEYPLDGAIDLAYQQFAGLDSWTKPLKGWKSRGIDGHHLGGYARIVTYREWRQAIEKFGCFYAGMRYLPEIKTPHAVLVLHVDQDGMTYVSWGEKRFSPWEQCEIDTAYAIAPKWKPVLLWWTIKNWFAKLWWTIKNWFAK